MREAETIFALSTPPGRSAIAVLRVSGPRSRQVIKDLAQVDNILHKVATLVKLRSFDTGEILDIAVALFFEGPKSYTGEDLLELHIHGGYAVVNGLLSELGKYNYLRLARNGEFTRRALMNNKLDLIEAEAVGDLIHAETSSQRRLAVKMLDSGQGAVYGEWKEHLIGVMANIEAYIDFPDDDLPDEILHGLKERIEDLIVEVESQLAASSSISHIMNGIRVTLCGVPNAGKSSIINLLSMQDTSIVSPIPGTTRDVVRTRLDIGGNLVILSDTAGIADYTDDAIEREGISKAIKEIEESDIVLWILSLDEEIDKQIREFDILFANEPSIENVIFVVNKVDLINSSDSADEKQKKLDIIKAAIINKRGESESKILTFSCPEYKNHLEDLIGAISQRINRIIPKSADSMIINARQRKCLEDCIYHLKEFKEDQLLEIGAQNIRDAVESLDFLIGRVNVEAVLDKIFSSFCIGK